MLRLGLDLGTNSIGWVLYRLNDADSPEPIEIVDGGVSIHSDGRNPKNRASNAADRRMKRGPRRNRDRTLRRRRRVAAQLRICGLLPDPAEDRAPWRQLDPLKLRAEALDRPLSRFELGRVLLSFAERRGFKSNRQADGGEEGAIRASTAELQRRIDQSGARTLGEYLWGRRQRGSTVRARPGGGPYLGGGLYPERSMIERELEAIRDAQAPHHPEVTADAWNDLVGSLLYQRPLRPVERGRCTLLPDENRVLKAEPLFQFFRILQEVNNVEVAPPGQAARPLTDEERERVVAKLRRSRTRRFDQLVADAGLPEGTRCNLRTVAREELDGDRAAVPLRAKKCFGRKWDRHSLEEQQQIVERLLADTNADDLVDWLMDEFGLDEAAAEAVSEAKLPPGTGNLSRAAIGRMLPFMQNGMRYHDAVTAAGLGRHSDRHGDASHERLPYYGSVLARYATGVKPDAASEVERFGRVANPTVHIALGQVRRLFNAIVDAYGKPNEVVVELSRDLKQTEEQRREDERRQRTNRERNDRLRELAEEAGVPEPSTQDMRKLRLWDEQGPPNQRVCPFTGTPLSIGRVLSDETEVEHLLPYSRTLDNSMNNSVVAMRHANREKANRTPFEAWGADSDRYGEILARAESLPTGKRWRFNADAMKRVSERSDFLDRQLNENRYLSRLVREYLECVVEHSSIWVTPGRMTALLRRAWGLESVLAAPDSDRKNREDHRHHMIDAAVVGMTSRSLLQRVAQAAGRGTDVDRIAADIPPPWPGFRRDMEALARNCIVRHRPDHFTVLGDKRERRRAGRDVTSGSLHNDTAYGVIDGPDEKGMMTLVERKHLTAIMPKDLERVRDLALKARLQSLWKQVQAENAESSESEQWQQFAPEARRQIGIRRVRLLTTMGEGSLAFIGDATGGFYKAYKTDGNAYMDIWLLPDGKTRGETVSRFDAHKQNGFSEIRAAHPTARKLMRLHRDDTVATGEGENRKILRVKALTAQMIELVDHAQAGKGKEMPSFRKSATRVLIEGMRKVSVDVLGRVHDGGPFKAEARQRSRE